MTKEEELFHEEIEEAYQNGHVDFLLQIAIYLHEKQGESLTNLEIQMMRSDILDTMELFNNALDFEI